MRSSFTYLSFIYCFLCFQISFLPGYAQNYQWAKNIPNALARAVAVDEEGNCYITGNFSDTVDFDPGVAISNLISSAGNDLFVAKYDIRGNYVWARSIITPDFDFSTGITDGIEATKAGGIYLTGSFHGTVDFDPGVGIANLTSNNSSGDLFIAYYSSKPTGIQEKINEVAVYVAPNPFNSTTTFFISSQKNPGSELKVYNLNGEVVREVNASSTEIKLERGDLPGGIYFYRICNATGIIATGKLFILN